MNRIIEIAVVVLLVILTIAVLSLTWVVVQPTLIQRKDIRTVADVVKKNGNVLRNAVIVNNQLNNQFLALERQVDELRKAAESVKGKKK